MHFVNRPVTKLAIDAQWQQLSEAEIRKMLQGAFGKGFFDIEVARIKADIEQHPWVAKASTQRIWPDTLAITITEHVPIARWGNNELLNQFGETFAPTNINSISHLPWLQGPEESQFQVMQQYQQFSQILFPAGLKITNLTLTPRGSWMLKVNDSLEVAAGRDDLAARLERFVDFYVGQPKTTADSFEAVDLRYGNGIAVRRMEQELTGIAIL